MSEAKTWRQEPFWKAVWIYMRKPKGILIEDHEQLLADYATLETGKWQALYRREKKTFYCGLHLTPELAFNAVIANRAKPQKEEERWANWKS